jgi:predicted ATPase
MNDERQQHLSDLLQVHQRRLRELERLVARKGVDTAVHIHMEIEDIRAEILRLEAMRLQNQVPTKSLSITTPAYPVSTLPAPAAAFIGREQEVSRICTMLRRHDVRLVTVTGPGGCGKTRLAIRVAQELQDAFTDGIIFVDLATTNDPDLVLPTIARALGIGEMTNQPLGERVTLYLREKHVLLLLDNCEHVIDAAPLFARHLSAAPHLKALVTSRAVLHLSGEHEVPLRPMAIPDRKSQWSATVVSAYDAVALFVARAQAVNSSFALTDENAGAIVELCHQIDGLPLAIELAASRCKFLTPEVLLQRLSNRLQVLTGGARDLPIRQQTLRNTVDWSFQLLNAGEQQLFLRLSVFASGFTLEAAEAVCGSDGELRLDILDGLASLVDKSLLQSVETSIQEPRFAMLETIREYAVERLERLLDVEDLSRQHAKYFLKLAETAESHLRGTERLLWRQRLEADYDNLRMALIWSQSAANRVDIGLGLASALGGFWITSGQWTEADYWINGMLAHSHQASTPALVKAYLMAGHLHFLHSDDSQADAFLEHGLRLALEINDKPNSARILQLRCRIATTRHQYDRAVEFGNQSLSLFRELGDQLGIAQTISDLGMLLLEQGNCAQAATLVEESLALYRALGDLHGIAAALNGLGEIARADGDVSNAARYYAESFGLWQAQQDPFGMITSLLGVGYIALRQSRADDARNAFMHSLTLCRELGDVVTTLESLAGLAGVIATGSSPRRAVRVFGGVMAQMQGIREQIAPVDQAEHDRSIIALRAQFDEATFSGEWEAGEAMSLEQTILEATRIED